MLRLLRCGQTPAPVFTQIACLKCTPVSAGTTPQKQALDGRGAKALPAAFDCLPALFQLSQEKHSMRAAAASGQSFSVPHLPSRTKRFWTKWEKRIKKCFPTPSSLWIQGQSAHPKFSFHLDIFRMRQKFQNQKTVQKLYLIFIKIRIFRIGGQFHDILLTGSWSFFL